MKKLCCALLVLALLAGLGACGKKEAEPELVYVDEGPVTVTEQPLSDAAILFSAGCAGEDMSVYARLASALDAAQIEYLRQNVGLVDLGGALRADETARYDVLDAMNRLGYEAAAVSPADLQTGVTALIQSANAADFPFLCADLTGESGDGVMDAWTLTWHGGHCIAFIGWCADGNGAPFAIADGEQTFHCTADAAALQTAADGARAAGAECVILLVSGMELSALQSLTAQLTGVDAAVDGGLSFSVQTDGAVPLMAVPGGGLGRLVVKADGGVELSAGALTAEADANMTDFLASLGYEAGTADEDQEDMP